MGGRASLYICVVFSCIIYFNTLGAREINPLGKALWGRDRLERAAKN